VAAAAHVAIYDVTGRRLATLVDETLPAGRHSLTWNGRSDAGQSLAPGVYFCRMQTGRFAATRRLLLLR
jgi:flagellar hook assembly protein FlgD